MALFDSCRITILLTGLFFYASGSAQPPGEKSSTCGCQKIPSRFGNLSPVHPDYKGMAKIPAGVFMMGGDNKQAKRDELPKHKVHIDSFWLDTTPVTNKRFRRFVRATGYVTVAEKIPDWNELKKQLPANTPKPAASKLVAASIVFTPPDHAVSLNDYGQWWTWLPGANWQHPRSASSNIDKLGNHPVVHVSWIDANEINTGYQHGAHGISVCKIKQQVWGHQVYSSPISESKYNDSRCASSWV